MTVRTTKVVRVTSVIAATVIALACGTNYAYSAWAVEFGKRMKLNSTQSNLIGTFGNLGMYTAGIPVGLLVDAKGPRPGAILGSILLGVGYFVPYRAYEGGPGSVSLGWLCFFTALTGIGGCAAFLGAVKTCALNWPNHRGTATAFPLAGFGLSAFFFSLLSSLAFPDNTSDLLLLLTILTFLMPLIGGLFLQIVPQTQGYAPLSNEETGSPTRLKRTISGGSKHTPQEAGTHTEVPADASDEVTSLLSNSSGGEEQAHGSADEQHRMNKIAHEYPDVRGLSMLPHVKFWQLWIMMGLFTGVGLMTINNIGNNAQAIWHHFDDSIPEKFIQQRELMHVEIISILSCIGRILSGIGSDVIVSRLHLSRFWCPVIASSIFCLSQIAGTQTSNPHSLWLVSSLTGLAYGFMFGCYPALVAETFGVHGLSQNWGFMTLGPILGGNAFNILYGRIYDANSVILPDGSRDCREGLECYRAAYVVTLVAALGGLALSLWSVWSDGRGRKSARRASERDA